MFHRLFTMNSHNYMVNTLLRKYQHVVFNKRTLVPCVGNYSTEGSAKKLPSNWILFRQKPLSSADQQTSAPNKPHKMVTSTADLMQQITRNIQQLKLTPIPTLTLGLAGLIPFVAAPGYIMLSQMYIPSIVHAQLAYGACILSFLGGVRWGMTVQENTAVKPSWLNLGYSVLPALIAWPALLVPDSLGMVIVITGLSISAYIDISLAGYPFWFKALRFLLSLGAILSLWTSFIYGFLLKEGKQLDDSHTMMHNDHNQNDVHHQSEHNVHNHSGSNQH